MSLTRYLPLAPLATKAPCLLAQVGTRRLEQTFSVPRARLPKHVQRPARLEADLEGLSSAYSHLEAHAFALEKRAREAELTSGGACLNSAAKPSGLFDECLPHHLHNNCTLAAAVRPSWNLLRV